LHIKFGKVYKIHFLQKKGNLIRITAKLQNK